MTASLFALCIYFLEEAECVKGKLEDRVNKAKELLSVSDYKYSTIKKEYYQIGKLSKNDPLNSKNISNSLKWLQDFPKAKELAEKQLYSFE
jgi:hypothetical protein